jgi:LDH2 family malate/lactate/ureidoglycolate dehydrogenase
MAIHIASFTNLKAFKKTTGEILRQLRASRKAPGHHRIYTCGEKEHLAWLERKDKGVPVNEELCREIVLMRDELGLKQHVFPFDRGRATARRAGGPKPQSPAAKERR